MSFDLKRQCRDCPWSKLTAPGKFPPERYENLHRETVVDESALMACHHTNGARTQTCVGFLSAEGRTLWRARYALALGRWSERDLVLRGEQHETFEAMARTHGAEIETPPWRR